MDHANFDLDEFLAASTIIDWTHPAVLAKAQALRGELPDERAIVAACFHFVRDEIKHCSDFHLDTLTCKASDVLAHGTGFCFAKSHLLAALLRANGIAAGLCYQRLTLDDDKPPFTLHGLNAVYLPELGWYRLDARGNRVDIDAQFTPPIERLAFAAKVAGEADLPGIWAEPLPAIVELLTSCTSVAEARQQLPDAEPAAWVAPANDILQLLPITPVSPMPPGCAASAQLAGDVRDSMRALYRQQGFVPPWIGYFAVLHGSCVGTCAFKSPPRQRRVELAYCTFPPYEGKGIATRMAGQLVALALASDEHMQVTAQTLPLANASTAILGNLGFHRVGEVQHPQDGLVWEWEL